MKRQFIFSLFLFTLSVCGSGLRAQSLKAGVVDAQYIKAALAARGQDQADHDKAEKALVAEMGPLEGELEKGRQVCQELKSKGDEPALLRLEGELRQMLHRLEALHAEVRDRRVQLNESRELRIKEAVKAVAAEKGYASVVSISAAPFHDEKDNISDLVLQKLGVGK
jgi:Skp family chaperone for outer membrane proteins